MAFIAPLNFLNFLYSHQRSGDFNVKIFFMLGEKGRRIRELTSVFQKRFKFPENSVELYAEKVNNRGLCAIAQAESLRYKLLGGLAVRRYILIISQILSNKA